MVENNFTAQVSPNTAKPSTEKNSSRAKGTARQLLILLSTNLRAAAPGRRWAFYSCYSRYRYEFKGRGPPCQNLLCCS